jgi:hypothetical protein
MTPALMTVPIPTPVYQSTAVDPMMVPEALVPVKLLINGDSIAQVRRYRVRYFHVELTHHSIILAEGLKVESYLDIGDRANFNQRGSVETIRLFPEFTTWLAPDSATVWEARGAAPLVLAGAALARARGLVAPLVSRKACVGWRPDARE